MQSLPDTHRLRGRVSGRDCTIARVGVYLRSIDGLEWFGDEADGFGYLAAGVNEELWRRGLPAFTSVPEAAPYGRSSGLEFEEKLVPQIESFVALCEEHLSAEEIETLCAWTFMVPVSLEEEIWLPIPADAAHEEMIAGAPQVLALAERMAAVLGLPVEARETGDGRNALTAWFLDGSAKELAGPSRAAWATDLDAAFYVAVFLRAARFSLRHGRPIRYS